MKSLYTHTLLVLSLLLLTDLAHSAPIYVIEQPDGSTKFTSKPPGAGVRAKVFTAKKASFSYYRSAPVKRGGRLFRERYHNLISAACNRYGVELSLVKAVIHVESAFDPYARSHKGAVGLMQLMPETAKINGVRNRYSPMDNILGGVKHLKRLIDKYRGELKLALAAYNAGEGAVQQYGGIPPYEETRNYVRRVLYYRRMYG